MQADAGRYREIQGDARLARLALLLGAQPRLVRGVGRRLELRVQLGRLGLARGRRPLRRRPLRRRPLRRRRRRRRLRRLLLGTLRGGALTLAERLLLLLVALGDGLDVVARGGVVLIRLLPRTLHHRRRLLRPEPLRRTSPVLVATRHRPLLHCAQGLAHLLSQAGAALRLALPPRLLRPHLGAPHRRLLCLPVAHSRRRRLARRRLARAVDRALRSGAPRLSHPADRRRRPFCHSTGSSSHRLRLRLLVRIRLWRAPQLLTLLLKLIVSSEAVGSGRADLDRGHLVLELVHRRRRWRGSRSPL